MAAEHALQTEELHVQCRAHGIGRASKASESGRWMRGVFLRASLQCREGLSQKDGFVCKYSFELAQFCLELVEDWCTCCFFCLEQVCTIGYPLLMLLLGFGEPWWPPSHTVTCFSCHRDAEKTANKELITSPSCVQYCFYEYLFVSQPAYLSAHVFVRLRSQLLVLLLACLFRSFVYLLCCSVFPPPFVRL